MFADQITDAIGRASLAGCDQLARDLWKGFAAGVLDDAATEAISGALEARRRALRGGPVIPKPERPSASIYPPRRAQISPDRRKSIERRRHLAASGPMPPALAARFTVSELAVLRVVADEVAAHGVCGLTLGEIAARAGTCRSVAQRALRAAAKAGMVVVEERRRPGRPNLPNVVRIISREWLAWLAKAPRRSERGGGCLLIAPTDIPFRNKGEADRRNTAPAARHGTEEGRSDQNG
jgi:hypothetical protein